jgi:hypothetical protein
MTFQLLG